jgi:hypothetical protein
VRKDPFHAINMVYVSKAHAFSRTFRRALSLAFFVHHPEDLKKVREVCERKGLKWEGVVRNRRKYINKRVRRMIPVDDVLAARIDHVFRTYGDKLDPKTKNPLFNADAKKKASNILASARAGELSDPPDTDFYSIKGTDPDGLTLYRCSRGTNGVEGGTHQKLIRKFKAPGRVDLREADANLAMIRHRHNVRQGITRKGHPDVGMPYTWVVNDADFLAGLLYPDKTFSPGLPNYRDYVSTGEQFGLAPVGLSLPQVGGCVIVFVSVF